MSNSKRNPPKLDIEAVRKPLDTDATQPLFIPEATESYFQFRELMSHLRQVFWIKDSKDRIVRYVSPAYEAIWGRSCQSLIDDPETFIAAIVPEDRDRMEDAIAGKHETEGYDEEFRILRPDGEMRWIWARGYPVRNDRGEVTRFAAIAEDITEKIAADEERSRLAAIIEYSDGGVVSITPNGIIVGWNDGAERQYGYTAEEIIGCSLSVLFPPGKDAEYAEVLRKVQRGERVPSYDTVRQRKDGILAHVSIGIVPIQARYGERPGASELGRDIEKIKSLERQVIEAQKMEVVGRLATGVAHDFNNLLSVIMGYAEVLMRTDDADPQTRKSAEEIQAAVIRASGLTQQLLLFSRRQAVKPVVLDLNAIVTETGELLGRLLGENVTLSIDTDERPASIDGDSGYIVQLLMNLAVNAREAMPGGGVLSIGLKHVTVTATGPDVPTAVPPGDYVSLSVSDTGVGMSDEVKAKIFEPFFTTKADGTGLGLATCWTIVEQCKAHVRVSSELDKGTTFDIYFPSVTDVADTPRPPRQPRPLSPGTELILVVEDEPTLRKLVCTLLKSLGYDVLQAVNGQDGLRVAREHKGPPIQLVVTDVAMPQMTGRVMAEWLKISHHDLRILFTSGYANDAIADDKAPDADIAFLAKPYSLADLSAKVRGLLDAPS